MVLLAWLEDPTAVAAGEHVAVGVEGNGSDDDDHVDMEGGEIVGEASVGQESLGGHSVGEG